MARMRVLFVYGFVKCGDRVEVNSEWAIDKGKQARV